MKENNLISGIFNYCDRWCEKCGYSNKCLVYQKETERNIKHLLHDEDPDDPKVFAKDIEDNLTEALEYLHKMVDNAEEEMDFDFVDEKVQEPNFEIYEVSRKSNEFFKDCFSLLKKIDFHLSLQKNELMLVNDEQKIMTEVSSLLSWYSPQIFVKCKRAISSLEELSANKNEEMEGFITESLNVTAKIAYLGIQNCLHALDDLYNLNNDFADEALDVLTVCKNIEKELLKLFPHISNYKRPYFD